MRRLWYGFLAWALALSSIPAAPATLARLLVAADAARPGDAVLAGVQLRMAPGWHTYWRNGGDAGLPIKVKWLLPQGITVDELAWPVPEKLTVANLVTYVYHNEVVLLTTLHLAGHLPAGPVDIKAQVAWVECEQGCRPGQAEVKTTLMIAPQIRRSSDAALLEAWQPRRPTSGANLGIKAWWEPGPAADTRLLLLEGPAGDAADFYPDAQVTCEVGGATEPMAAAPGAVRLRKVVRTYSGQWPANLPGLWVAQSEGGRKGWEVAPPIEAGNLPKTAVAVNAKPSDTTGEAGEKSATITLWLALQLALLGGLILNFMPCVLPVISLKILGFVNQARLSPARVRLLGLTYGAGVVVSFLILAGGVIAVQTAGRLAGWGMQFQSPVFLVLAATLVTLVALNLFGVFEVRLGGSPLDAAAGLATQEGLAGAFLNGVLTVVLATPCTAPFLGIALGYALAQSSFVIVLTFVMVATGLALPYVVLSFFPAWLSFLPKPGAWMAQFKAAMGFPMLATALWLFTVAMDHFGKQVLWLGVFLILVALAAWFFGEFYQRRQDHPRWALALVLVLLFVGYGYALEYGLDWRHPTPVLSSGLHQGGPEGIAWQPWTPQAVAQARRDGQVVLVDFTADWCLTCRVNAKTSLEIPAVRAKLKALNVVTLRGDYTRKDDTLTAELRKFKRAGVPLVLVYPRQSTAAPLVLPEILTPKLVLEALDRAAQ